MSNFSKLSISRLQTCDQRLQYLFSEIIKNYDIIILCGNRNKEDQDLAVKDGKSKLQYPNSKHNSYPSLAVDVAPYWGTIPHVRFGTFAEFNSSQELMHGYNSFGAYKERCFSEFIYLSKIVMEKAKEMDISIRWGGDWNQDGKWQDEKFLDLPHYEILTLK